MKEINFTRDVLPLKDRLFRLALRTTLDRAESEDIVQETLLRIWDMRDEWREIDSIEAYATTICRRLAIDATKKAARQNVTLDEQRDATPAGTTPYEQLDAKQRLHIVRQLLDTLPEQQRAIMLLRDIEGHTYQEIGQTLGLSESQVKVYLFRARQKIKKQFAKIE